MNKLMFEANTQLLSVLLCLSLKVIQRVPEVLSRTCLVNIFVSPSRDR